MKKVLPLVSLVLCVLIFAACAGAAQSASTAPAKYGSSADYKALIQAAREAELNESSLYNVVTSAQDPLHSAIFTGFQLVEEDYEKYAISAGAVITIAYGVFIILPKEGRQEAVIAQVEAFVEQQQKAMENYLQPQYEIAKAAIIKTAPSGEVILAMCKDAETVMKSIEDGLKAGAA